MKRTFILVAVLSLVGCAPSVTQKERASGRIHYDIGVTALNEGDVRTALRELLAAVEADPELSEAHNALGLVFHAKNRRAEALEHYDRAIELKPKFSAAHNNRGVLLLDMERYAEAITSFQKALSDILYATPSLAEGNMGWAYYRKGDVKAGLRHLQNAVATNPKFCRGYGWLAELSLDTKAPEQAVAYCQRFFKHCVDDPAVRAKVPEEFLRTMHFFLGRGYVEIGDRQRAREALERCAGEGVEGEVSAKCARLRATLD